MCNLIMVLLNTFILIYLNFNIVVRRVFFLEHVSHQNYPILRYFCSFFHILSVINIFIVHQLTIRLKGAP